MNLHGKVAVITGAAGHLGREVVTHFLAQGARVAATDRKPEKLQQLAESLPPGDTWRIIPCDVTDEPAVERMMGEAHEALGGPDILLNIAGGYSFGASVMDTDLATWQHMMNLNLTSVFLCTRHALKYMLPQGFGRIVSVGSKVAVDLPDKAAAYATSKAGILSLTRCLAREIKGTGVAVAAILPSVIDTPANREAMPKGNPEKWVKPHEIARVMAWLCGEDGETVNGAVLPMYGELA